MWHGNAVNGAIVMMELIGGVFGGVFGASKNIFLAKVRDSPLGMRLSP